MWFDGWDELGRVAIGAVLVYLVLVLLVRLSGKRTIASMNVADFVITVAIGSGVATTILDRQLSLATGIFALTMLVALQFLTQFAGSRSRLVKDAIEAAPRLLAYRGRILDDALRYENVNESEVLQALREHGVGRVEDVYAVVMEIDGEFSVLTSSPDGQPRTAMQDVKYRSRR